MHAFPPLWQWSALADSETNHRLEVNVPPEARSRVYGSGQRALKGWDGHGCLPACEGCLVVLHSARASYIHGHRDGGFWGGQSVHRGEGGGGRRYQSLEGGPQRSVQMGTLLTPGDIKP